VTHVYINLVLLPLFIMVLLLVGVSAVHVGGFVVGWIIGIPIVIFMKKRFGL
jgi:hypothetical protein